ncbi:MAG: NAD(P)H-quinone oxidoreductase [Cyclobacteriaceae bacterium]|nr:NAD(P)H-quinone oxidoreductase [Cyclobacteriaceae bacterium]
MKSVLLKQFGGREQLYIGDQPIPSPTKDQVLVKVTAAALNRADILQREGKYPPPKGESEILGLEIAGEIVALGANVQNHALGSNVFGILPGGGYSQYAIIHKDMALPIPKHLSFEEAAAIPEAFLTAYQSLLWHANTTAQDKVLIHAGGSGVGTAAIQLVKKIGATCIITASSSKHNTCYDLGADYCIDYNSKNFQEVIATKYNSVDVIIDFLGASYFTKNISCLARDGRMVMLALLGGTKVEDMNIAPILFNRLNIIGSTLRSRNLDYQIKLTKEFWSFSEKYFRTGELKPIIDKTFRLEEVKDAHRYMEENKNIGKIVLTIN